jgi:hypothetical protein
MVSGLFSVVAGVFGVIVVFAFVGVISFGDRCRGLGAGRGRGRPGSLLGFRFIDVVFGGVVLDAVAVVVVVFVGSQILGVEAVHGLADFEDGLGAVGFVGELEAAAVLGDEGGVDLGLVAACGEEEQ